MPPRRLRAFALDFVRGRFTRRGAAHVAMLLMGATLMSVPSTAAAFYPGGVGSLAAGAAGARAASGLTNPRAVTDQPDEKTGSQVHLVYVLPSDGVDRALDVNGTIDGSIASAQVWLASQTNGRALRLDTLAGSPDISFVRLSQTRAAVAAQGVFVRDVVAGALAAAGFNDPNKLYLVWYDGLSTSSCGAGPAPPAQPAATTVLYLQGEPPGAPPCVTDAFAAAGAPAGYWEFVALHETLHALGFVPACAPHSTPDGHVSAPANDLMYAGNQPWDIAHMVLDFDHDDYFQHNQSNCPDLADSAFLDADPSSPVIPAPPATPLPAPPLPIATPAPVTNASPQAQLPAHLGSLTGIPRIQRGAALTGHLTLNGPADEVTIEAYVRARLLKPRAPALPTQTRIGVYAKPAKAGRLAFRLVLTRAMRTKLAAHKYVTITLRITLRAGDIDVVQSKQVTWKAA